MRVLSSVPFCRLLSLVWKSCLISRWLPIRLRLSIARLCRWLILIVHLSILLVASVIHSRVAKLLRIRCAVYRRVLIRLDNARFQSSFIAVPIVTASVGVRAVRRMVLIVLITYEIVLMIFDGLVSFGASAAEKAEAAD